MNINPQTSFIDGVSVLDSKMKEPLLNYFQRYRALGKIQNFVGSRCISASLNLMGSTATSPVISSALFNYQQNHLNLLQTGIFFWSCLDEAFLNFSRWDLEFYFYDAADFE